MTDNEKELFINFCNHYLMKTMKNSKQRFLRREKRNKRELILNMKNSEGQEFAETFVGSNDVDIEEMFTISDLLEDNILFLAYMSLSAKEKEIVDYRLKGYKYSEINKILNFKRPTTAGEIYNKSIKKMRKLYLQNGGKKYEGK